jgi:polysaccharide pyruvyl transferase WcaK-like protein
VRIHLGHNFYGAGNVGDDFMLAGFLSAMRVLVPSASFTACVPFPLAPLRNRFPEIEWRPYTNLDRAECIIASDVWLGLGGSPFQSAQSRWFIDHLLGEAAFCRKSGRPMYYIGIGVQTQTEVATPEVEELCRQAAKIWTRDTSSAARIARLPNCAPVSTAADLAHLFFREVTPPTACAGRLTLVPNFDYGLWPGWATVLQAIDSANPRERVWLAQESRELPGAERALFAALHPAEQAKWRLVVANDDIGLSLAHKSGPWPTAGDILRKWPSGEWLITARYHAALAGAWAQSKIVVIVTNEKLRGVADELQAGSIPPDSNVDTATRALMKAENVLRPVESAKRAMNACAEFVNLVLKT